MSQLIARKLHNFLLLIEHGGLLPTEHKTISDLLFSNLRQFLDSEYGLKAKTNSVESVVEARSPEAAMPKQEKPQGMIKEFSLA